MLDYKIIIIISDGSGRRTCTLSINNHFICEINEYCLRRLLEVRPFEMESSDGVELYTIDVS